ncbi:hypothetical protein MuYL_4871 [Mucilaginibacter xinganensis]|uniref:Uncharacterized protein n=1 Tax=Mucilaginibacter xinganensis TaxID=1234841 RepID=A0A223P461_9SPHI|nr:hypothetical protein MuYL_4871 [Mucilaginibacter xinganensis]
MHTMAPIFKLEIPYYQLFEWFLNCFGNGLAADSFRSNNV